MQSREQSHADGNCNGNDKKVDKQRGYESV
jgi:hypothetical protein